MIGIKVKTDDKYAYVTMNYRHIVENNWLDDLKYMCEPTEYHERRTTVRFVCDRSITHELVRHRTFSFLQESTRYCNYSNKDKFGNEVTFIIPCWEQLPEGHMNSNEFYIYEQRYGVATRVFLTTLYWSESNYFDLLNEGWKPQQARIVLPNALKTELIMTGFVSDWWGEYKVYDKETGKFLYTIPGKNFLEVEKVDKETHRVEEKGFFPLRCSKAAHPQMRELAIPLRGEFIKRYW